MKVIYCPGFGAGWSTWGDKASCLDQELAEAIQADKPFAEISAIAEKNWPGQYQGGLEDGARVVELPKGTRFEIREYDGSESLFLPDDSDFLTA